MVLECSSDPWIAVKLVGKRQPFGFFTFQFIGVYLPITFFITTKIDCFVSCSKPFPLLFI